jgi:uncharacterized protein YbjT (DUF2867 family)
MSPDEAADVQLLVIGSARGTGRLLVEQAVAAGHDVRAMIRDPQQAAALEALGATTVVADLEGELDHAFRDVDAVAFCAGSGSATGPDATLRVDLHGAVRTIDACRSHDVRRYVMLSAIAADDPRRGPERLRHYLAAKHAADRILLDSGLDATVVRPGRLTHDRATGRIELGDPRVTERGSIPRADVAAVMLGCLARPWTVGAAFEVVSGDTPIDVALDAGRPSPSA